MNRNTYFYYYADGMLFLINLEEWKEPNTYQRRVLNYLTKEMEFCNKIDFSEEFHEKVEKLKK